MNMFFKDISCMNKSDIEKELNKLDGLIKTFATKQNKEINKIDFGNQYKKEIEDIEKDLNKLADNEDLLRGKKLDQEKAYYQKQKDIAEKALQGHYDGVISSNVKYFKQCKHNSSFFNKLRMIKREQDHCFYREHTSDRR